LIIFSSRLIEGFFDTYFFANSSHASMPPVKLTVEIPLLDRKPCAIPLLFPNRHTIIYSFDWSNLSKLCGISPKEICLAPGIIPSATSSSSRTSIMCRLSRLFIFLSSSSAIISGTNNRPVYKDLCLYLFLQLLRGYNKRFIEKRQLLRRRMKNNLFL